MLARFGVGCAWIALACGVARGADPDRPVDLRCGTYSLFVALRAIGLGPASFELLEKKAGPPGPLGYSVLQLEELARGEGAQTIAVESNLEKLRARPEPFACIALLDHHHFVLLHDFDDSKAYLVDPPASKVLPIDTFRRAWTKKALLVGRLPFRPEESIRLPIRWGRAIAWGLGVPSALIALLLATSTLRRRLVPAKGVGLRVGLLTLASGLGLAGCGGSTAQGPVPGVPAAAPNPASLVVEPAEHRLGDVLRERPDATVDVTTTLRNVGGESLRIGTIRIGCTCTAASLSRELIPPGGTATLTTSIKLGDSPMPRESSLTIFNSSADRPALTLGFRWRSVNRVRVEPASCEWSRLRRGETAERSLEVIVNGLGLCPSCRIEFGPGSGVLSGEVIPVDGARTGHASPPVGPSNRVIARLVARARAIGELGARREESILSIRCGEEERARVAVPASWSVTAPVEVAPERLSLGSCRPGDRIERKVLLGSDDGQPFRVGRVACGQDGVVGSIDRGGESKVRHRLDPTFQVPEVDGPWRADLVIETDREDAGRLVIPVSALVHAAQ